MKSLLAHIRPYQIFLREGARGGFSHAYLLLCGDGDVLSKALSLFAGEFFTGNERAKNLIEKGSFSDCLFFPKDGKKLSVEDANLIVEEAGIRPIEGDKKVFVIDGFHTALPSFQNKLLKILEEPPEGVYFLLGATTEFSLLPTILSRVKKLEFAPFSVEEVSGYLGRNYPTLSKEELRFFSSASCGKISSAQAFIEDGGYEETFTDAINLSLAPVDKLPALCKKVAEKGKKDLLLSLLEIIFRDAAFLATKKGLDTYLLTTFYQKELEKLVFSYPIGVLLDFQNHLHEAQKQLKFNATFGWCLQVLFTNLAAKRKR